MRCRQLLLLTAAQIVDIIRITVTWISNLLSFLYLQCHQIVIRYQKISTTMKVCVHYLILLVVVLKKVITGNHPTWAKWTRSTLEFIFCCCAIYKFAKIGFCQLLKFLKFYMTTYMDEFWVRSIDWISSANSFLEIKLSNQSILEAAMSLHIELHDCIDVVLETV